MNYRSVRMRKARSLVVQNKADAFLVTNSLNIHYLTGLPGEDAALIMPHNGRPLYLSDFRYKERLSSSGHVSVDIRAGAETFYDQLKRLLGKRRIKRILIESNSVSVSRFELMRKNLKGVSLKKSSGLIESLRLIKDEEELKLLRKSSQINQKVLKHLIGLVKPGITARDLALEGEYFLRKLGTQPAFPLMVLTGRNTACPHGQTLARKITSKGMILFDLGVKHKGYASDLTRTFVLDKMTDHFKRIYTIVKDVQEETVSKIRPGVRIGDVDKTARNLFAKHKLDKYFGHSLGHGIGLEVHESPKIFYKNNDALKEGMVFTVEPGVYLPRWGGIRIEDMVAVTKNGFRWLSSFDKENPILK